MMDALTRETSQTAPTGLSAPYAVAADEARPYHHGDLSRALVAAAQRILERDGAAALSLRAVAREAGVSPAAPYHHFKDKSDLLQAVAMEGFDALAVAMKAARDAEPDDPLTAMGVAYVVFARENPPRYRVMYDCSREKAKLPEEETANPGPNAYDMVREALISTGAVAADDPLGLELSAGAMWCAVHGLAEMADFEHFKPLVEAVGGPLAFYRATLAHLGHAPAK